jgi:signal transduction histidine kinase
MLELRRRGRTFLPTRLAQRFLIATALAILTSMAALSLAVSHTLQTSLTHSAAEEGATLIDFFLGPSVQELATATALSEERIRELDELLASKLNKRTKAFKVWLRDGTLVYSTNKKSIGQKFPSREIDDAFAGQASGTFEELGNAEDEAEKHAHGHLIEIYAPLYRTGTAEIIAVGEAYNSGERLAAELSSVRIVLAVIFAGVTAPVLILLFFLVKRADARVDAHRQRLQAAIVDAKALAAQNDRLRREAEESRAETIHSNERLLNQIGQDIHDGPIQMLGILGLRLRDTEDPLRSTKDESSPLGPAELLQSTLRDLRNITTGLVLPQLDGLTTEETLRLAVRQHQDMTGTSVACEIGALPNCSPSLKICLFRFIQEALNNAYSYADGRGQSVVASCESRMITVVVSDSGAGIPTPRTPPGRIGLGLAGLRRRVEALHGTFEVIVRPNGTRVSACIPIDYLGF